ncbi:MAG: tRNA pseudouridine(38-40) synthase TruA [Acidobacteriota bacterium]|jgi:tRNA pseudouridine38-40 synthase
MASSMRVALRLAYLGHAFAGWQKQRARRTVQGELEGALERLYARPVTVVGAGRTDAGVHAAGQVAHYDAPHPIPPAGVLAALNTLLPDEIRVLGAKCVPQTFHAQRDALAKVYCYRLAWGAPLPPWEAQRRVLLPSRPDLAAMRQGMAVLAGTHDFAAFARRGHSGTGQRGTVRTLSAVDLRGHGRRLDLVFAGDGFLRGMVRRLVGALLEIGRGKQDAAWLAALLGDPGVDPPAPTAVADGLTLERVVYRRRSASSA